MSVVGSSAEVHQGQTQGISRAMCPSLGAPRRKLFPISLNFWLNTIPCICRNEIPFSLPVVSQGLVFAPGGCLHSFSCFRNGPKHVRLSPFPASNVPDFPVYHFSLASRQMKFSACEGSDDCIWAPR